MKRFNTALDNAKGTYLQEGPSVDLKEIVQGFLQFTKKHLKYQNPPKVVLSKNHSQVLKVRALGCYNMDDNLIWLYVRNRNAADILRTLGHELVHVKQLEDNKSVDGSTGSSDENEANSQAGVLLRNYGALHPEIYN